MPVTKKRTTRKYKKRTKRTTKASLYRTPRMKYSGGFPETKTVKLKYCDYFTIDPQTGGSLGSYLFRANSIYDPNYTGTGHQPLGYDQWAGLYNHYTVISSKINISIIPNLTTSQYLPGNVVGIFLSDDVTFSGTNLTQLMEQGYTNYKYLQMYPGNGVDTLKHSFNAKRFYNVKDVKDNQVTLGALVGSNPSEEAYFVCFVGAADSTTDTASIGCVVTMEYLVTFTEPKEIAQS